MRASASTFEHKIKYEHEALLDFHNIMKEEKIGVLLLTSSCPAIVTLSRFKQSD